MTAQNTHADAYNPARSATICDLIMDIGQANPLLTFVDIYAMVTSQLDALEAYALEWDTVNASQRAADDPSTIVMEDNAAGVGVTFYPHGGIWLDAPKGEAMSPAQARAAARLLLAMANEVDPVCAPLAPVVPLPEYVNVCTLPDGAVSGMDGDLKITRDAAGVLWLALDDTNWEPDACGGPDYDAEAARLDAYGPWPVLLVSEAGPLVNIYTTNECFIMPAATYAAALA